MARIPDKNYQTSSLTVTIEKNKEAYCSIPWRNRDMEKQKVSISLRGSRITRKQTKFVAYMICLEPHCLRRQPSRKLGTHLQGYVDDPGL
ncbi:hypothetical protein TNCV_1763601 [Trichonephila clavipes]|nr:hypothetical protein TNCV_1763601 [Trichonephila clavipes]